MNFQYNVPVNLVFGRGRLSEVGAQTAKYGKRALVVTGRNSTKKSGLLDKTLGYLKANGVDSVLFDQVEQNPLTTTVHEGATLASDTGCDVIVGLGGGSIMDAAKAIALMAVSGGGIDDYIYARKTPDRALPIILVPTTCGTGSEANGLAVLSNPVTYDKKSIKSNVIIAKASIIDPELMVTIPKDILASVGFDALCHNMEAYLSPLSQPLSDMMALKGIELIGENLPKLCNGGSDMDAWEKLTLGSTLGGMVIYAAGVTAGHAMEHPASGLKNIVHGKGLAALTPAIFAESISGAPGKFAVISKLLGGRDENDCVDTLLSFLEKINLKITLGQQGIREEDVDWMAENCLKVSAAGIANNPVVYGIEDIKRIYKKAL